ncbi:MAG: carboxymuconolactone decarboxylase family protein [Dehalococcoidia bacterium]
MPRLPFLDNRNDLPPDALPAFDAIIGSRGRMNAPMGLLMYSPNAADRVAHLGNYLRFESNLSPAIRELAIITAAREFDCAFVWAAHVPAALEAGIRQEVIDAVATFGDISGLSEDEAAVVRLGRELVGGHQVSQATFDTARARFGERGLVDLTTLMGYYLVIATTLITMDVDIPEGRPELPVARTR